MNNIIKTSPFGLGWLAAPALAAALLLSSGCFLVVGAAAGAGTVAFVEGKLTVTLPNDYEAVRHASNKAIAQLQYAKIREQQDDHPGEVGHSDEITARTTGDDKVEITVTREGENLTKVEIRVGTFGDKQVSTMILDRIKSNL